MSEPLGMTILHRLSRQEAKSRIQNGFGQVRSQFPGFEDHWTDDRMDFRLVAVGQTVTGRIDVLDDNVRIEVNLPGLLGWFGRAIGQRIRHQASLMLEKK